jgi:hypothetical protein
MHNYRINHHTLHLREGRLAKTIKETDYKNVYELAWLPLLNCSHMEKRTLRLEYFSALHIKVRAFETSENYERIT